MLVGSGWLAIALGGALGAVCRALVYLSLAEPDHVRWFPLPTLVVNIVGSFIIGVAYFMLVEQVSIPLVWRQFAMVGFLGAFTTFSTFSLDAFRLLQAGEVAGALACIIASVTGCLLATWAGYGLASKVLT